MTRLPSLVSRTPIVLIATISSFVSPFAIQAGDTPGGLSGIAEREIARRMGRMEDARQAIERGDKAYAEGDFETALGQYKAAIEALPDAPTTQEWRTLAKAKFADASVALAKERAKNGRYAEAQQLLDGALAINSEHKAAKLLKKQLDDPDRYPPALTPEHVAKVERVQRGLQMANSEQDLGKFDEANKEFQKTLLDDQYNIAARRGMERTEQMRSEYFDAARDHQRARMLNLVSEGWEDKVPVAVTNVDSGVGSITQNAGKYLSIKMKSIVFPQVSFTGATIDEAVEYLRVKSRDLDTTEPDPTRRGVNIILKAGETPSAATITLDLKDVPMEEALRYIVELAGMKFKVEPFAVLVVPISESTTEQFTRIYKVPPDFQTMSGSDGAAPAAAPDPFAAAPAGGAAASTLKPKAGAKDILTAQGIPFPEGASAVFNPVNSQLIVKNTQPNLDMVETFVDSLKDKAPKQIYITTKFVEVSQKNTDELGFDWLLGPFSVPGSDRVFGTGGTLGNSPNGSLQNQSGATVDFPFLNPGAGSSPIGNNPVSRGLRFGSSAIAPDSIDGLISASAAVSSVSPGIFALSGVLTDPQFQVVVRALNQKKGVDLMSAPSVTTKGGQRATIEVIREFIYPTEFDPPQIPQQFGGNAGGTSNILTGASSQGSFPVTPTTPTAFEMKPIGVRMEVDPVVGPDGYTIDLTLAPEVTEFEGFINYGSPIQTGSTDALGNPTTITLTENRIPQPIFSTRKLQTQVSVWDGQTVAMGGLIREDVQDVEDKVPLLGDLPIIGRLFQTKAEDHFKRNLMIFVTAVLIDPSGQRIKGQSVSVSPVDAGAGAGAPDPSLLGARP